ncbi:MAG: hypothetical protein LBL13_08200, partial [Bacteroidales bacterium]|nr:hypothetical protein [Bacteroidales bacterium]
MKKIIIFGFISLFSTVATAQILTFETVGNVELCDRCDGSELCMLKCNACKVQYRDGFVRLFRYETKRLGEIQNLSEDEQQRQMISLKAYINGEINRIKGHIQFCVQSEMRQEEAIQRAVTVAAQKEQEPSTTYTPRSVTEGVKMGMTEGISKAGDNAANTLAQRNADNIRRGELAEKEIEYRKYREKAAKRKIDELIDEATRMGYNNSYKKPANLKANLQAQIKNSQQENEDAKKECLKREEEARKSNDI